MGLYVNFPGFRQFGIEEVYYCTLSLGEGLPQLVKLFKPWRYKSVHHTYYPNSRPNVGDEQRLRTVRLCGNKGATWSRVGLDRPCIGRYSCIFSCEHLLVATVLELHFFSQCRLLLSPVILAIERNLFFGHIFWTLRRVPKYSFSVRPRTHNRHIRTVRINHCNLWFFFISHQHFPEPTLDRVIWHDDVHRPDRRIEPSKWFGHRTPGCFVHNPNPALSLNQGQGLPLKLISRYAW